VNIFVLSGVPSIIPMYMHDKHVVKMALETAQLLSNQHHKYNSVFKEVVYKPTHMNHPCSVWAGESSHNYDWLFTHFEALLVEYRHRYYRRHKCSEILDFLRDNPVPFTAGARINAMPPQCMPDKYKGYDVVEAYRAYYKAEKLTYMHKGKQRKHTWTNQDRPWWLEVD